VQPLGPVTGAPPYEPVNSRDEDEENKSVAEDGEELLEEEEDISAEEVEHWRNGLRVGTTNLGISMVIQSRDSNT